jgi:hypothetical protein
MYKVGLLLAVIVLAGCPGATGDPCSGVTCAPGRTCVEGVCKPDDGCGGMGPCPSGYDCIGGQCVPAYQDLGVLPDLFSQLDLKSSDDAGGYDGPRPDGVPDGSDAYLPKDSKVPDGPVDTVPPPDIDPGRWYQANSKDCAPFCSGIGRSNDVSPEGARCMSGENRPQSGIDQGIKFTYGCWPNCAAQAPPIPASSQGPFCYRPGQKTDGDGSDLTVGCYCI